MKKLKNAVFSVLNILVIAGILLFIMVGLMKIGILEVPGFLKGFLGTEASDNSSDNTEDADFLKQSDNTAEQEVHSAKLTGENVKRILSELDASKKYAHDLQYTLFSENGSLTKRVFVMKNNETYCAFFLSGDGSVEKQIINDGSTTYVNTIASDKLRTISYPNGYVDFAEQIGVIITHKDFLNAPDDPNYSFEIESDDFGTLMLISFLTQSDDYSQLQHYTLNLDYGIVTEARCYENDKLIYELTTNSLSQSIVPNFVIPKLLEEQLPKDFEELITES